MKLLGEKARWSGAELVWSRWVTLGWAAMGSEVVMAEAGTLIWNKYFYTGGANIFGGEEILQSQAVNHK